MSAVLPRLRFNLEFLPSPDPGRPGLFIRDPYHYSDATLLIPPVLVETLECFDGVQTTLELRAELVRITGEIQVGQIEENLFASLDEAGFLENETYRNLKAAREAEFAAEPTRTAIFAGAAYPADRVTLGDLLTGKVGEPQGSTATIAIAAPHASPDGGWSTYRAAYRSLPSKEEAEERTFIVLGTSHYGAPERFGLTRKAFVTPYGQTETDVALVDEIARLAPDSIRMEDYCHSVEHSIEFQVVFLQHLYGPKVRVLPILCGPFVKSIYNGGLPEETDSIARFFGTLQDIYARDAHKLLWVLGVDMAHMGRRYGDPLIARADAGEMLGVEERDRERIAALASGDARAYWSQVQNGHDDLKWCGASPFYTFLKVMPPLRGELLDYHQWQIDPQSVVTFGAMRFEKSNGVG